MNSMFKTLGAFALVAFLFSACSQEDISPDESLAFSSNGDKTNYDFTLKNGKSNWSDNGTYELRIVADEKVREIFIKSSKTPNGDWARVDPKSGVYGKGSFDADAALRNGDCGLFNSDKKGLNAFAVGPLVYVTFGNKYATLRVDSGEVFRESGICGSFPSGISCVDYLPFPRLADFTFDKKGVFIAVTNDGFIAASKEISGNYKEPGRELGTTNSNSDVNYNWRTAGKVKCLDVTGFKSVKFELEDGSSIVGFAQRGANEFIKVD